MLAKYFNKINGFQFLFSLICVKIMVLLFVFDLNYKYKKFQEVNSFLFQNLDLKPKLEKNRFVINNWNNLSKILKITSFKIKKFHFSPFGDHIQEPIAKIILSFFFNINETGYSDPNPHKNKYMSNPYEIANMITLFSIIICIPSILFLASNNWKKRLFACVAFQIKNISDYIDGPIIRNFVISRPSGTFNYGRLLDGLASALPDAFLLIGSFIFIFRSLGLSYFILNGKKDNELNIFYKCWYKVSKFVFEKIKFTNKNAYSKLPKTDHDLVNYNLNIKLVKKVYFKMTVFLIYFVLCGIHWNWNLDKYKDTYAKEFISKVSNILIF